MAPADQSTPVWRPTWFFYACDRHRFVCCIPLKNASTTLKHWMALAAGIDESRIRNQGVHDLCTDEFSFCNRSWDERRRILAEYCCFAVVRDPIDRIASAYIDRFHARRLHDSTKEVIEAVAVERGHELRYDTQIPVGLTPNAPLTKADSRINYADGVPFPDFVAYLERTTDDALDPHWKPMHRFFDDDRFDIRFDHIVHVESLERDMLRVLDATGCPTPLPPPRNTTSAASAGLPRKRELLTGDLRARLEARYRVDLELLDQIRRGTWAKVRLSGARSG